ncbi:hypothetical protein BLOT_007579 [Blomia tropicalis]|nr:hypothetical protein BLOT_007579 [Blomia tropicalis]
MTLDKRKNQMLFHMVDSIVFMGKLSSIIGNKRFFPIVEPNLSLGKSSQSSNTSLLLFMYFFI